MDNKIYGVTNAWAEETIFHNQYLVFEIGNEISRLTLVDLSLKEEIDSVEMPTLKYNKTNKPFETKFIRESLLTKLILAVPAA